jgi:pyrroloquinoline-quinone synthase
LNLIDELKFTVENHSVLKNPWLQKRKNNLSREDLILWLSQEYFVSIQFVNWFLIASTLTESIDAKIILVRNIWEELGEGKSNEAHVSILIEFLKKIGVDIEKIKILPETKNYLDQMKEIISRDFYSSLGALGPANEFLLKLEYGQMYDSYSELKKIEALPTSKFFQVNLSADESHSETLFRLIDLISDTVEKKDWVRKGNLDALEAREIFYEGLLKCETTI